MTHPHHSKTPKAKPKASNKIGNNLVALSSAAVLAVYTAGYLRTSAAAEKLEASSSQRRTAAPVHVPAGASVSAPHQPSDSPVSQTAPRAAIGSPGPGVPAPASSVAAVPGGSASQDRARVNDVSNALTAPAAVPAAPASTLVAAAVPEPVPAVAPVVAGVEHPAPEPAAAPLAPAASKYKDGTYLGWGTSRHGDIQAAVVIEGGRIVSATIAQCLTRYSCSWIADLPPQVVKRQSPEVDYVSGATQSTNAFYFGIVEALAKAK